MYYVVIYLPIIKHLLFPVVFLTNIFSMNIFFLTTLWPNFYSLLLSILRDEILWSQSNSLFLKALAVTRNFTDQWGQGGGSWERGDKHSQNDFKLDVLI